MVEVRVRRVEDAPHALQGGSTVVPPDWALWLIVAVFAVAWGAWVCALANHTEEENPWN